MSALDPLLGRILTNDVEIELSAGLNFKNGLSAAINPSTGLTEISPAGGTALHSEIQAPANHGIVAASSLSHPNLGPYVNAPDRLTKGALLSATDVGKACLQSDTGQYWILTGVGSWQLLCGPRTIYTQPGATYTFAMADMQALGLFTNAGGALCTIPLNATVPFPIGAELEICQSAAGQVGFSPFSGAVSLQAPDAKLGTRVQFSCAKARKVGTDTWLISGDLAALGFGGDFGSITPSCVGYWRGDLGLGLTSTTVNSWANQIAAGAGIAGNAIEVSSTVGMGVTDAGVGGRAAISSNGSTHGGKYAYVPPTPATQNFHIYCVYQAANKGSNQVITGTSINEALLWEPGGAGNVAAYNGANNTTTRTANTWARLRCSFTGATSGTADKIKWGSTAEVGGFSGNGISSTANRGIFSDEAGGQKLQGKIALMLLSTATEAAWVAALSTLDAAVTSWFGAGNVLV